AVLFELLANLRHGRCLLTDSDVDAHHVLALLVDDRIDRNRGLTGLAVADDKFTLSAADRHHRIDRLQSGLKRFFNGLAIDDTGSDTLDRIVCVRNDLALAVDRVSESVNDAADHRIPDRNAHNAACSLNFVAFFYLLEITEKNAADVVFFEVECEAANSVRELEQFAGHDLLKAVDLGDTVADL